MRTACLLDPESVAVVGTSENPAKLGSQVLHNLLAGGYAGRVYAVGRSAALPQIPSFPDATSLPEAVDVAFLAVPAEAAVAVAGECAARGVRSVIVASSGFAEDSDPSGRARQAALTGIARASGMRVLGPNCNGLYNPHRRLSLGFNAAHTEILAPGGVALLSHSGALFETMVRRLEMIGAGLSAFVSLGNEADLDVLDLLEDQIENASTRVIALVIDALADAERFAGLAARAHALSKPLVVLKLGRSDLGAAAAVAHSSRMVGDVEAYEALFRRCGAYSCRSLEGFVDAAALLDRFGVRPGGMAALSSSGAAAALMADTAARHDVSTPPYGPATEARLAALRRFAKVANPTDLGVFAGAMRYEEIVPAIAEDPGIGALLLLTHNIPKLRSDVVPAMGASQRATGKAHVLLTPGRLPPEELAAARAEGVVVLTETDAAVQAIGALTRPAWRGEAEVEAASSPIPPPSAQLLGELQSLQLLGEAGLPTVASVSCRGIEACVAAADRLGWPVALKAEIEGISHKSDHGLVETGLADPGQLRAAYGRMGAPSKALVQPMLTGDLEIIIGLTLDPGSGMTLLAGLGGVHAEALGQIVRWSAPVSADALGRELDRSVLGRIFASHRWRHPAARAELIALMLKLQSFGLAARGWLEAVDVNPVIVTGEGLIAVDALIRARDLLRPAFAEDFTQRGRSPP